MKKIKNRLDERQEQKMLKIEHYGFWLMFWGIYLAILVQTFMGNNENREQLLKTIAGEYMVVLPVSVFVVVSCVINGIWDRHLKPNFKTNLILSICAAVVMGIIVAGRTFYMQQNLIGAVITFLITGVAMLVLAVIFLSIASALYKIRAKKIESDLENRADENERT